MRGQRHYQRHAIQSDPRYQSEKVAKFINYIMQKGKKNLATQIVYRSFEHIESKLGKAPLEIFESAIKNVEPIVEVRSRRIGGATYQVPMEVRPNRRLALAMRWIIDAARAQQGKPIAEYLADELIHAYGKTGTAMTIRERMHKMAEANRAFAHFVRYQ